MLNKGVVLSSRIIFWWNYIQVLTYTHIHYTYTHELTLWKKEIDQRGNFALPFSEREKKINKRENLAKNEKVIWNRDTTKG